MRGGGERLVEESVKYGMGPFPNELYILEEISVGRGLAMQDMHLKSNFFEDACTRLSNMVIGEKETKVCSG